MTFLVDSSVCLRTIELSDPLRLPTISSLEKAERNGHLFFVTSQIVAESWSLLTRPVAQNGFGQVPQAAREEIDKLLASYPPLSDPEGLGTTLANFAERHQVSGRQIHDARLALTVELLGLDGIVTYNKADFTRYTSIEALEPAELSSP